MLDRWLAAGLPPERVRVVNRSGVAPRVGIATVTDLPAEPPAVLVVAVKPQQLAEAQAALATVTGGMPELLISILAGVDIATLRARLPARGHLRAMPNLPVALGRGVTLLHGDPAARGISDVLAAPLGLAEWIDDEGDFDAATALAGSGPGFLFRFIGALGEAGAALGLDRAQAERLALATVAGSAALAAGGDAPPVELARRVASKGGSTQAGYDVLDDADALTDLMTRTLTAAARCNAELGVAARDA